MKLNMGCGHNRFDGWVNVDAAPACEPDQIWDLEQTPWPWPDNSADQVRFIHSLEHMGADARLFLSMMAELYRIAAPDCLVEIVVPHPRHDNFINDPTHVRVITPQVLELFDRARNDDWKARRCANSPLAHYTGVDFVITDVKQVLSPDYQAALQAGTIKQEDLPRLASERNNVVAEIQIKLRARK
jgi:hypothetical protein